MSIALIRSSIHRRAQMVLFTGSACQEPQASRPHSHPRTHLTGLNCHSLPRHGCQNIPGSSPAPQMRVRIQLLLHGLELNRKPRIGRRLFSSDSLEAAPGGSSPSVQTAGKSFRKSDMQAGTQCHFSLCVLPPVVSLCDAMARRLCRHTRGATVR